MHVQELIRRRQAEGGKPRSGLFMQELPQNDLQRGQYLEPSVKVGAQLGGTRSYACPCQGRPAEVAITFTATKHCMDHVICLLTALPRPASQTQAAAVGILFLWLIS